MIFIVDLFLSLVEDVVFSSSSIMSKPKTLDSILTFLELDFSISQVFLKCWGLFFTGLFCIVGGPVLPKKFIFCFLSYNFYRLAPRKSLRMLDKKRQQGIDIITMRLLNERYCLRQNVNYNSCIRLDLYLLSLGWECLVMGLVLTQPGLSKYLVRTPDWYYVLLYPTVVIGIP